MKALRFWLEAGEAAVPLWSPDQRVARGLGWLAAIGLTLFIALPLLAILLQAVIDSESRQLSLAPVQAVLASPGFLDSLLGSLTVSLATVALVLPTALVFAFALTRSRMPGRGLFKLLALSPLLAPSLMPGISLVYLFGNQGLLKSWLGDASIYGPIGIVLGEAFYTFPHALLILLTALAVADARLYEAAETLGASRLRRLLTVTLPNARYGLISAGLVVFTLAMTDFGVAKVIGGQYKVLALEAYKQVIGQQNFGKGAVIGLMLLLPAVLSLLVERWVAGSRSASLGGRSVAFHPPENRWRDGVLWLFCGGVLIGLLALLGVAMAASFIKLWPYSLELTLGHYDFDQMDGGGWQAFRNSVQMAAWTALIGTLGVFGVAYLLEKMPLPPLARQICRTLALLPMAVPGLVLGLGYIFCFNHPANPLHGLYGSLAILVLATVAHFYTTAHLTISTALRQLDGEIEAVSATLCRPFWVTVWRVTLPICLPALFDVARFFFVSALTTVSCVIFLYTPDTVLAGVAVLNMDDAGETAGAAAMATLIVATALLASLLLSAAGSLLNRRAQAWRGQPH